ncbi:MAG: methylenetetrahydrofolate reductase [NAD(P)H] [Betaproteobacteria bacterium]|nr:methylenetetrahydrofolate reductase [NAD(P)H] [Betaproteobacteria bacterium]
MHPTATALSFEFFPPKSPEGCRRLREVWSELALLQPHFFSVTYGAGGSTQAGTLDTVREIQSAGHRAAPHLSCVGACLEETETILDQYRASGIQHIVALRGDLPSGTVGAGDLAHASDLVTLIRKSTGAHFRIDVACYPECHPQARSVHDDLMNFKRKVDAGANGAITQYFYNADSYFRFVDECAAARIDIPIVPGIMPIGNFSQLARFSDACGAEVPRWLRLRMQSYGDDIASIRALGLDVVCALCERLLAGGARGLHFYTLNHADLATQICKQIGAAP